jgi:hypothetical protein
LLACSLARCLACCPTGLLTRTKCLLACIQVKGSEAGEKSTGAKVRAVARQLAHSLLALSLTRSLIRSLIRSVARQLAHSLLALSLTRSLIRSLIRSLVHSLAHSLAQSLAHSLTHSSLSRSLARSLASSLSPSRSLTRRRRAAKLEANPRALRSLYLYLARLDLDLDLSFSLALFMRAAVLLSCTASTAVLYRVCLRQCSLSLACNMSLKSAHEQNFSCLIMCACDMVCRSLYISCTCLDSRSRLGHTFAHSLACSLAHSLARLHTGGWREIKAWQGYPPSTRSHSHSLVNTFALKLKKTNNWKTKENPCLSISQ